MTYVPDLRKLKGQRKTSGPILKSCLENSSLDFDPHTRILLDIYIYIYMVNFLYASIILSFTFMIIKIYEHII